jgi:hypothetical protein
MSGDPPIIEMASTAAAAARGSFSLLNRVFQTVERL